MALTHKDDLTGTLPVVPPVVKPNIPIELMIWLCVALSLFACFGFCL